MDMSYGPGREIVKLTSASCWKYDLIKEENLFFNLINLTALVLILSFNIFSLSFFMVDNLLVIALNLLVD